MLSKQKKIEIIRDLSEKHEITAYELGENTDVSAMGAHNILTGDSKNPRNKTLNTLLEYIENKITATQLNEPITIYPTTEKPLPEAIATEVVNKLAPFLQRLDQLETQNAACAKILLEIELIKEKLRL